MAKLSTFAAVFRFAIELENEAMTFYKHVAEKFTEAKAFFLASAEKNMRRKDLLKRIRQEVITDAIETGYTFMDLRQSDYVFKINLASDITYINALKQAEKIEEKSYRFYLDSAKKAGPLLSDVGRPFEKLARENFDRKLKLNSLKALQNSSG